MSTPFSRSLRSLETDRFRTTLVALAVGAVLFVAWGLWFFLSRVAMYEVSDRARLEVDREVHPLMVQVSGRVVRSDMTLGDDVEEGDVLVELDGSEIRFQLDEKRAEADGLRKQLERLQGEIAAQGRALSQARRAEGSAYEEARARHQELVESARFAQQEAERMASLHQQGLVSRAEADSAETEARQREIAAVVQLRSLERLENDRRFEQSEKQADVSALERRAAEIEAMLVGLVAVEKRLAYELERHTVRAPISGRIGDMVSLQVGEVVEPSDQLGTVIPSGVIRVVAEFAPHRALGRIQPGQAAKLRLQGFSWVQYGSVPATVSSVASEPQNGTVRVELVLEDTSHYPVELHHGLPGTLEVEVERLSPAALVLRAAGNLVSRPVGGVETLTR